MDIHYNAFISYRHHPDDIKVAEQIHKKLEHFKIPRAIKKRGKIQNIRLFRDKEELPATSSLSSDITHALENSDYLIVICSPHTKESVWVQREIETFLRTHTRDQVLTVLAEGEPYDVIPKILLHEDVTNPETGEVERREYEPLSCDWRAGKRKAVREELPRLAASLLGCGYDELRQRQRQYRMRRLTAMFVVLLLISVSLTAYFIYTNAKIQENLELALENQSKYLVTAAEEKLNSGDRQMAISLAIEALPSKDNNRPYVPQAERLLSDALASYWAREVLSVQGVFRTDTVVEDFVLSSDGNYLAILEGRGYVSIWDTKTMQQLAIIDFSGKGINEISFLASGNITVKGKDQLLCYQPDGTLIWQAEQKDAAFLDNRQKVLLCQYNENYQEQYAIFDANSGELICSVVPPTLDGDLGHWDFMLQDGTSDGVMPIQCWRSGDYDEESIFLFDMQTTQMLELMHWNDDDTSLLEAQMDENGNLMLLFNSNKEAQYTLHCYDTQTQELKWQSEFSDNVSNATSVTAFEPLPGENEWLLQLDNEIWTVNRAGGKKTHIATLDSIPLSWYMDDTEIRAIAQNGKQYIFPSDEHHYLYDSVVGSELDGAIDNGDMYVHVPLKNYVARYRTINDPNGIIYENEENYTLREVCNGNDYCFVLGYEEVKYGENDTVYAYDIHEKKQLWKQDVAYLLSLLGVSENGNVWLTEDFDDYFVELSAADGTQKIHKPDLGQYGSIYYVYFTKDKLLYITYNDVFCLNRMDLNTADVELMLELPENYGAIMSASQDYVWFWDESKSIVSVLDLQSGEVRQVLSDVVGKPMGAWNETADELLIALGHELLLARADGEILQRIELGDMKALTTYFYEEQLLVFCDNGILYRYDRQGQLLSQAELTLQEYFYTWIDYLDEKSVDWWRTDDGELIFCVMGTGHIIDCTHWCSRAYIPNFVTYLPQTDEIICQSFDQQLVDHLYAYPRYTTEQQIARGVEVLGDFTMTEDQRSSYGLN